MTKVGVAVAPMTVLGLLGTVGEAIAGGRSEPWQMWFQDPASPVMERIMWFHDLLFVLEVVIVILVLGILAAIIFRFNAKSNPVPSKTTHNTLLEVIWTGVPIFILMIVAVPSLKLLYYADSTQDTEMILKVTGNQWYWSYAYPDHGGFEFDSLLIPEEELKGGQPRLLSVDSPVVLPAKTNIRLIFTSADVIHNWAIPSLGVRIDTVPGRVSESWVHINAEGDYYGMCSELCGVNHGFMPIHIQAVSKADFAAWIETAKKEYADTDREPAVRMATADARSR